MEVRECVISREASSEESGDGGRRLREACLSTMSQRRQIRR